MNQPSLRKSNVKANAAGLACSNGLLGSQECTGASHCRFQPRALSRAQKSNIIQCFLMSACPTGAIAATSFPILPSLQWQEATRWKLLLLGWRPSLQEQEATIYSQASLWSSEYPTNLTQFQLSVKLRVSNSSGRNVRPSSDLQSNRLNSGLFLAILNKRRHQWPPKLAQPIYSPKWRFNIFKSTTMIRL